MTVVKHIDAFAEAACRVLEEQVFMFGELLEKSELACDTDQYLMASVSFEGPELGKCFWIGSDAFGTELAANMLGVELDDPLAASGRRDALKELSNVVCCQFLTSVYGSEPIFHLASPILQTLDRENWSLYIQSRDTVGIVVEEHPVLLGLILQDR
jgi:CheY-specific phosphatase CheX